MKKLTLFLVAILAMVNVANAQRAWAYDLELTPSVDSYTFAFKAVTAGDATLVFYKEGVEAGTLDLGAVSAGANTVTKTSEELLAAIQQSGDFTWGVKMSAGAIAAGTELKQLNSTLYYNMMGIVADVDPESEHFGKVYMQMSYDGKPTYGTTKQTQGFFIYDPIFNLISTPNVGIKPTLPTGYTFDGTNRLQFHRVAIDPKTGNLAFCYSIANKPGVFSIGRNNLTGEVTNLLAGVTGIENIKRTNALCFDEDGALYIIADVTTLSSTGNIYKIVDGVATKLSLKTPSGKSIWIDEQVGLVSDGRGGLWVAQNRSGITDNSAVFHVNVAKDTVDFVLEKGKTYSDWFTGGNGNNCRGGIAYNVKENVLATHSEDAKVSLFKVTYDEETGVPTITKWIQGATGGKNTDAIAFDYAGDLYTGNSSGEYFRKFEVPTTNNTCTTPAKKSQVITLVAPSIALNAHPVKDYSASIVGTMKRAIQNGENTIVLTHEDNGTPHIYSIAHATKTITEISQEGVIAVDPDNAGDYLAISDIALTEDGKLIASNYMRCEQGTTPATGYKVGEIRYYIWNDITAAPIRWFTTNRTANSTYADVSYTFAIKGTSTNAQLMSTAVHNNNRAARINLHTVVNGTESAYHRFGLHTTASEYTEAKQGVNFQLTATPLDNIWTLEGELTDVTSFAVPATTGDPYTGTAFKNTDLGKKYNGVSYLANYNGRHLMVAPYADGDGKLAGVKVLDITNGFAAAIQITTSTDLTSAISATAAAATAYVDGDGDLTIYLFADSKVYAFSEKEYTAATYTVTATANEGGSVEGGGTYDEGSTATLTATPAEHYEFTDWTGDVTSTDNPLIVEVNSDMNITANFVKKKYTLTVFVNDENKGTIDVATGSHEYGTEVTLTATPKEGYKLLAWSNKATTPSITLTIDNNKAVSAYFVKEYANEPTFTIEKVWENTKVPELTGNGYQGVGWDGTIYVQDAGNKKILTYSDADDTGTEYVTSSGVGQQIAVDEAGNLIVFNATFYTANPNAIIIYPNGSTTGTPVSFTLDAPERCDFLTASGNIYSAEGGYVYFFCKGQKTISRLFIKNGAATAEDVTDDTIANITNAAATQSNVVLDIYGNIHTQSKNAGAFEYNITTLTSTADPYLAKKNSTIGGCTFELGGKEFWAYVAGTTDYSSEWQLINATDGKLVSEEILFAKDKTSKNSAANWLNVQVEDEKTAYIYQFCPTVAAAVWKVSFKENYTVSATANPVAGGTVTGADTYQEGAAATLTATPNTGYKFVNWTKGGETITDNPYTFTVSDNVALVANFEALAQYKINAHADHTTHGYVTGSGDYYEGEEVTLKAVAKSGYYFTKWNDGNTDNPRTITVDGDKEYIAEFAEAYPRVYAYDLNVVDNGDTYTFSFKPNTDAISGNLLLYSEDGTTVAKTVAITTPIVANTVNSITLSKTDLPDQSEVPWAIELSGNAIPTFAEAFADSDLRYARAHAVVDNSPESEYFGRIYVADRRKTKSNSKVYVYNPDFTDFTNTNLGLATAGYSRPAVGTDGTLYLTGYTDDAEAGIFVVNPADLTKCTQFFNGTYDSDGLYKNNGKEIGSSTSGVGVYGAGKDAVLYTMMEDGSNANVNSGKQPIVKYQIGQENGTVLKQWSDEPTWLVNYPATGKDSYNFGNNDFAATAKGVWVSQNKSNPDDRPEIAFIDKTGNIQFMQNSKPSLGGGMTVNADNTVLYIVEDSKILEYAIAWNENIPSLTLSNTYPISLAYVSTLSMDYAGNLIACAGTTYATTDDNKMKVVCFTLPTDNNHSIVPAAKTKAIKLGTRYTVTVNVNDETMGEVIGGGSYKGGETATIAASAKANHRFVKWTKDGETVSNVDSYSFEVTKDVTYTANFEPIPQYTIIADPNDPIMGTVSGYGTYYEGDDVTLTATAKAGYVFVKWSDEETDESRTFTASENVTLQAIFKVATPRAWAYDLKKGEDSDNYTFTFTATSDGNATILFTDKDGNAVAPTQEVVGAVTAGETKTVSIDKDLFTGTKDIYWSVKVDGAPIEKMAEITDPTKGIYDIVAPQGIAVDNNTDSKHFGQVYVAAATDGTVSRGAQTRGIFVYNPILNELNSPNAGYLPANATLTSNTRQAIHRVAVNPTNNQVAFAYNISGSTAVWSMNPENLADNAINLIESAGLSKVNSLCFDESGALYVMENANVSTGGKIYRIQDGVADVFANVQAGYNWVTEENTIVSDGRGGLWIAQNRWQVDGYPALSHVDKTGIVDFAVTSSSPEALKALFPHDDNNASYRGQCAYYVADDILAFGGNKEAVLFKVTYDANNAPTNLEKLMSTGKIGLNIDGLAFDYAGDLYVASETTHRMYKFVIPTDNNTCIVPAPESQVIQKETRYTVTVAVNDNAMGTATGGGTDFLAGDIATLSATANDGYQFVNWTKDGVEVSTETSFDYTVPAENVTLFANFEVKPLAIKGIVKRAVQIGESTVVLTHEADGTPHLYKVVDGALEAEISQVGVIARDPDNAGDYLAISDIAATEDGKLVACNYILCQNEDGNVDDGYKRGESKFYIWENLTSKPSVWFTSKMTSNWFRSKQGYTMAVKGTSQNAEIFTTGTHGTNGRTRFSWYHIIDGVFEEPAVNTNDYYHFHSGPDNIHATDNSLEKLVGAQYELNASPLVADRWIMDGNLVEPYEYVLPATNNVALTAGAALTTDLGKKFNGATYLTVLGKHLMVAPYADSENVAGVTVLDITKGLDQAEDIDYAELTSPVLATAAATAVKVNGDDLTITLVVDNEIHVFTIDLNLQYTRTVTNGDFGTICLPYGSSSYNGAEFYEIVYLELQADGVTPKGIWLDEVEVPGVLVAGKPYIFKATSNLLTVNYEGAEVLNPIEGKAGLTGTFIDIPPTNTVLEGNYMIADNKFWLCGTGCWLNANRAYIDKNILHNNTTPVAAIPGRRRVMMGAAGENTTTGIDNLTEGGAIVPNMEGTYDVLGRKMNEPNNTGFYIVNGKKVVIVK